MKTKNLVLVMLSMQFSVYRIGPGTGTSRDSTSSQTRGSILYVKPGRWRMLSWGDACDLQTAILTTTGNGSRVAAGTPKPCILNREATFLQSRCRHLWRFHCRWNVGTKKRTNLTTLSGEIGVETTIGDNSYHVVTGSGVDAAAILDGFTIVAGNANGSSPNNCGGGMYNTSGAATLSNLTFSANSAAFGGGICNHENSNLTLEDVVFSSNIASDSGTRSITPTAIQL